jgi:adhesin transport system outer membrane protein
MSPASALPASALPASTGGATNIAQVGALTLKESILFALARDPSISQQTAQIGISAAQVKEAQSYWYPQISLNANTGHSKTTDSSGSLDSTAAYGLAITQLIYDFGRTNNLIDQQKSLHQSYRYQLMSVLTDVAEKTSLAYIEVKRYEALIAVTHSNIEALRSVANLAQLRADAGVNSQSDVLQTQVKISNMMGSLEQYKSSMNAAITRLGVLTGIQAKQYKDLPKALAQTPEPLKTINYSQIPAVLAANEQQEAAKYAADGAKSGHYPTLSIQAGKTRYQGSDRDFWDDKIQFNVDVPVYQGGAVSSRVAQAVGAQQVAASQKEQAQFDVLQKASVAQTDWQGAAARENTGKQQVNNAEQVREVYKNEYTLSKRSLNDLLTVEQDIYQAEIAHTMAIYDKWIAAVTYQAAIDNLLPTAGIPKPAQTTLPSL